MLLLRLESLAGNKFFWRNTVMSGEEKTQPSREFISQRWSKIVIASRIRCISVIFYIDLCMDI